MRKTLTSLAFLACSSLAVAGAVIKAPVGWSTNRITMGAAVTGEANFYPVAGSASTNNLLSRPVGSVFTYVGNGSGDRGQIILNPPKVANILKYAENYQEKSNKSVIPVFVFYSVDGSDGAWAIQQDLDIGTGSTTNLQDHFINLIRFCQTLEAEYKTKGIRSTVILNPDFLGQLHKECQKNYCPIPIARAGTPEPTTMQAVDLKDSLPQAISYLQGKDYVNKSLSIPSEFTASGTTLVDYIGAVNWIMKTFAPDIPFSWQDNVWAGDSKGHLWLHQARMTSGVLAQHVADEANYLRTMLFNSKYQQYRPDFLTFDKWERDVFDSGLNGAGYNNGYLYNFGDWNVYMGYVGGLSRAFNNIPLMLWQVPGGHLQTKTDLDQRHNHASTAPDYFFGDSSLQDNLSNVDSYITDTTFKIPANYGVSSNRVVNYLMLCGPKACPNGGNQYLWHEGHMQQVKDDHVFAMLWGGGSTTGVIGVNDALNDNGWLYDKITAYQNSQEEQGHERSK